MTTTAIIATVLRFLTVSGLIYVTVAARRLAQVEMRALAASRRGLSRATKLGFAPLIAELEYRIADHQRRLRWLRLVGLHFLIPIEPERPRQ